MSIDLPMKEIVLDAMLRALDEKKREELIRSALVALMATGSSSSYGGRSELQRTFDNDVSNVARTMVAEHFTADTPEAIKLRGDIAGLINAGWRKVLADPEKLTDKIADAITRAFTPEYR